jgi:hypothetical protein
MKNYSIKIALRGVSPMVWRRLKVSGDTSLAALHYIIQIAYGWDDEFSHQFHIYGKDYGIARAGGICVEDAFSVLIDDFDFGIGDRFTYEYNFFRFWLVDIRIEAIDGKIKVKKLPVCISGKGMPEATKVDEYDKLQSIIEEFTQYYETITVGDVRCLLEELDTVRFNRKKCNQRLATLDLQDPTIDQVIFIGCCPWREDDDEIQYTDCD